MTTCDTTLKALALAVAIAGVVPPAARANAIYEFVPMSPTPALRLDAIAAAAPKQGSAVLMAAALALLGLSHRPHAGRRPCHERLRDGMRAKSA